MGDNVCLTEQDVEGKYRAGFLNLCATDILDQVTLGRGAVLCIMECCPASPTPTLGMTRHHTFPSLHF